MTNSSVEGETLMIDSVDDIAPPQHLLSDYIEMTYLGLVLVIGVPSNCLVLSRLLSQYKAASRDSVKAGYLLLKLNLNVSDLMLLLIMALGRFIWLMVYEWRGGDALCKSYNFLVMASLYKSSNIVVCISLDRLRTVLGASKIRRGKAMRAVRWLLLWSWLLSLVWSVPQLVVWRAVNVFPHNAHGWVQCTDIWQINELVRVEGEPAIAPEWMLTETVRRAYDITHLILVFWGPLVVLLVSYAIIAMRLARFTLQGPQSANMGLLDSHANAEPASYTTSNCRNVQEEEPSVVVVIEKKTNKVEVWKAKKPPREAKSVSSMQPLWRRRLRGKLFRSTLLIVAAHFLFWFPYNFQAITAHINRPLHELLSDHANVFKDLQLMITLINPFLYVFAQ